jgi:hypothetical protein
VAKIEGISTTLKLVDQMTAPIMGINNAINLTTDRFRALEQASNVDAASLTAMKNQINLANAAAEMMNQTFADTQQNIEGCSGAQEAVNNKIREASSPLDGMLGKIKAAVAAYATFEGAKKLLALSDETANVNLECPSPASSSQIPKLRSFSG